MRKDQLQYLADSILIEELISLEYGLTKQAGLFEDLSLSSIGTSIKEFVKSHVREDAPGGYVGSVLGLMAPAVFFRIHPFIGGLYLIASQLGFDIQSVLSKLSTAIEQQIGQGNGLSASDVSDLGKQIIDGMVSEAAPDDLLEPLRKLSSDQQLYKFAQAYNKDELLSKLFGNKGPGLPKTPWLFGSGSIIQRIFGSLLSLPSGKGKAKWLLGGFIIWIVKTILAGAGLLAGAEAISKLVKKPAPEEIPPSETPAKSENQTTDNRPVVTSILPSQPLPNMLPNKELWVVPLIGTVENTLVAWVKDLYPQLVRQVKNFEEQLYNSPIFKEVAQSLKDPRKVGKKYLVMPEQFSNRQQVVDLLIKDIK